MLTCTLAGSGNQVSCSMCSTSCTSAVPAGAVDSEHAPGSKALREFIPAAAELARQRSLEQTSARGQLAIIRTALRMGRQVAPLESFC